MPTLELFLNYAIHNWALAAIAVLFVVWVACKLVGAVDAAIRGGK